MKRIDVMTTEDYISTKMRHAQHIFGMLTVFSCLHFHFTYAAFPLERDVTDFAGIVPAKRWTVFMEQRVKTCFNEIKHNVYHSLIDAVRCMTKMQRASKCTYQSSRYNLICPNIVQVRSGRYDVRIRIAIHQQFSINITIFGLPDRKEVTLNDTRNVYSYRGPIYTFTFTNPNNIIYSSHSTNIQSEYSVVHNLSIEYEYSVVQSFNVTHFQQIRATPMYFKWSNSLITCFHIQVDMAARVILNVILCLRCKVIVYDGPNERLPVIMKFNDIDKDQRVEASTFQVFFVVIGSQQHQETLTYAPIYRSTTVFNLSSVEHQKLHFNNATYCTGNSMVSRQCVFTFYTYHWETIRFSLADLQLMGDYQGTNLAAGIVLFNYFHGKREKICEILRHIDAFNTKYVDLIGTGNKMDVVVFVYSVFASLSMKFVVASTNCNTLLVLGNSISYTRYISSVDHTRRIFEIKKSAQEIFQSNGCLRVQSISSTHSFQFLLPRSVPALVTTMKGIGHMGQYCEINLMSPNYFIYGLRVANKIFIVTSIESNCTYVESSIQAIEIKLLPCKVPCTCLQGRLCHSFEMIRWPDDNNTCDICQTAYVFSNQFWSTLKSNVSVDMRIKSNTCLRVTLWIRDNKHDTFESPSFGINLYRSITIKVPYFTLVHLCLHSTKCSLEIPLTAMPLSFELPPKRIGRRVPLTKFMVKTAYWRGCLYRLFSRASSVSWDTAAKSCQQAGQSLLTIHSAEEFDFIKETFLQPHDTLMLFVGMKRKVMYLNWVVITSIG